jgi:nitrogen fixation protein
MKSYVTEVCIEDDLKECAVIVKTNDEATAEITLKNGIHTAASWHELSTAIYDAIKLLELESDEK